MILLPEVLSQFPPGFGHLPTFFISNDTFIALTFEVLLPTSSKDANPSSGSIDVQGTAEDITEGA